MTARIGRLYRYLLAVLPTPFRRDYADLMTAAFVEQLRNTHGPAVRLRLCADELLALLRLAVREHLSAFGNRPLATIRGDSRMQRILHDLRIAIRALMRDPAYAITAILTLALGIGGTTAIFSVVSSVILHPLPYPAGDQLVRVLEVKRGGVPQNVASIPNALDWRQRSRAIESLAIVNAQITSNILGNDEPLHVSAARVSDGFFETVQTHPVLGRGFSAADLAAGAPQTVVLSYALWRDRFGRDSSIVGRSINLNGASAVVVGVMPAQFAIPNATTALWLPLVITPGSGLATPDGRWARMFEVYARVRPTTSLDAANREMDAVARQLETENPGPNGQMGARMVRLKDYMVGDADLTLWIMLGTAAIVLLIACVNVSNLSLARLDARRGEVAIRIAHGATWRDLTAQFLAESVAITVPGALLGVACGFAAVRLLVAAGPASIPRISEVRVDLQALAATLTVAMLIALAIGLASVWLTRRSDAAVALRTGPRGTETRTQRRVRAAFVASEIALAVVLLIGAGLLVTSYRRLIAVQPGFRGDRVLTMTLSPRGAAARAPGYLASMYGQVVARVRALPGVQDASITDALPLTGGGTQWTFVLEGAAPPAPGHEPRVETHVVDEDYFQALDIPVLAGRGLERGDSSSASPRVVVNAAFAKRYFPGTSAVGHRIALGSASSHDSLMTIVGVVGDVRGESLALDPVPDLYLRYSGNTAAADMTLLVHSAIPSEQMTTIVRSTIHEVAHDVPVTHERTLSAALESSVGSERFRTTLIGVYASLAMLMAAIGVFGVMAQSVIQRRRTFAIRMALGARRERIVGSVLREGMTLASIGLVAGLSVSVVATRFLQSMLFGTSRSDPVVIANVVVGFLGVAAIACAAPAIKAMRSDPASVLRAD